MALITLSDSVGRGGKNQPIDVAAIGLALVLIGADRGGIFGVPLSIGGLAEAIESFQRFQHLPSHDGKVDRVGATLRRINEILNPGAIPGPPAPGPSPGGGQIRPLQGVSGLATTVNKNTWSPVFASLTSEMVFRWEGASGAGAMSYFELTDNVAPKWFGVLVPSGVTSFERINIFFHPTPSQAGFKDSNYSTPGAFTPIFHYLSDDFGAQFCASGTNRILIMPLMTQAAAGDCGTFPQRWESIVNQIVVALGGSGRVSDVVVSSFSSGISYSHQFRRRAGLGGKLTGVIDLDGIVSSFSTFSTSLAGSAGRVVRVQQSGVASASQLGRLAAQNTFPVPRPRWGGPFANLFSTNPKQALLQIHGTVPQTMMFTASKRAG